MACSFNTRHINFSDSVEINIASKNFCFWLAFWFMTELSFTFYLKAIKMFWDTLFCESKPFPYNPKVLLNSNEWQVFLTILSPPDL